MEAVKTVMSREHYECEAVLSHKAAVMDRIADRKGRHNGSGKRRHRTWVHNDEVACECLSADDTVWNEWTTMPDHWNLESQRRRRCSEHRRTAAAIGRSHAVGFGWADKAC